MLLPRAPRATPARTFECMGFRVEGSCDARIEVVLSGRALLLLHDDSGRFITTLRIIEASAAEDATWRPKGLRPMEIVSRISPGIGRGQWSLPPAPPLK